MKQAVVWVIECKGHTGWEIRGVAFTRERARKVGRQYRQSRIRKYVREEV